MLTNRVPLPSGGSYIIHHAYSLKESAGVTVLVVISLLSLLAVVGLLAAISLSAFNTRYSLERHLFVRTHVAAYFICILLCDLIQALGSLMNSRWISRMGVDAGGACTTQAIFKHVSDVGTAFWTFVIALHTFFLLVLEVKLRTFVLWASLFGGWAFIGAIVIGGPATLDTDKFGPFHGVSGYWCWITDGYPRQRLTLGYLIMFLSAFFSFILYLLIFLRLRGNLTRRGWRFRLSLVRDRSGNSHFEDQAMAVARQMLLYPVAYIILILPMAAVRISAWAGKTVPFEATIFSAAVFLLSGVVNVVLFASTRRVLPPQSLKVRNMFRITPEMVNIPEATEPAPEDNDPYYASNRDTYYSSEDGSTLNESTIEEGKMKMPEPTIYPEPEPGHNRSDSSSSTESGSSRSSRGGTRTFSRQPSPRGGKRPAADSLAPIAVPYPDGVTGVTNMRRMYIPDPTAKPQEFGDVSLKTDDDGQPQRRRF